MPLSSIGFGVDPFGSGQFGMGDWAEQVTWKIIPDFYKELDNNNLGSLVDKPLRKFIDSIKPLFQELRIKLYRFPTLWDSIKCPLPQLPALAYNIGIDISSTQTIELKNIVTAPFTISEVVRGSISLTTGNISTINSDNFTIINVVGNGFQIGEKIVGASSGKSAEIISITDAGTSKVLRVKTFQVGETVKGLTTSSRGVIGSVSTDIITIDSITGSGFLNGETLSGLTSEASAVVNGITIDGKSESFLRSQVLNAPQLFLNKGTDKGYKIAAAFEGLIVDITPLWAEDCGPDPLKRLLTIEDPDGSSYITYYDHIASDMVSADKFYIDPFDAWPRKVESVQIRPDLPGGRCRSYSLRLYFRTPDNTEIEDYDSVSLRVKRNLERFRPIHVRFDSIRFDGPSDSSGDWLTGPVIAENNDTAIFTTSVIGDLRDSSSAWSITNFNATSES